MGPETKVEALEKLENFRLKIGYPDKWRDYSALQVVPGDLVGNAERAGRFEWDYRRNRIEQSGRQGRVGNDPADGERLLFVGEERDRLPRRDPSAALLRSRRRSGGQLRRHRRRDRPRDHPRLRRPGPQVRLGRSAARLVEARGRRQVRGPGDPARRAICRLRLPQPAGHAHQRRGSRWARISATSAGSISASTPIATSLGGKPGAGARRLHAATSASSWPGPRCGGPCGATTRCGSRSSTARTRPGQIRAFAPLRNIDAWYKAFDVKPGDKHYIAPEQRARIW